VAGTAARTVILGSGCTGDGAAPASAASAQDALHRHCYTPSRHARPADG
jgi:hypothetical protein